MKVFLGEPASTAAMLRVWMRGEEFEEEGGRSREEVEGGTCRERERERERDSFTQTHTHKFHMGGKSMYHTKRSKVTHPRGGGNSGGVVFVVRDRVKLVHPHITITWNMLAVQLRVQF